MTHFVVDYHIHVGAQEVEDAETMASTGLFYTKV